MENQNPPRLQARATPPWAVSRSHSHPAALPTPFPPTPGPPLHWVLTCFPHHTGRHRLKQIPAAFLHSDLPQVPAPDLLLFLPDEQSHFPILFFSSKTRRCLLIYQDISEQGKVVLFKTHKGGMWEGKLLPCVPKRNIFPASTVLTFFLWGIKNSCVSTSGSILL